MVKGHKKQFEFLQKKFESKQLAHAYILTGEKQIGKFEFAKEFSEFVGCRFPDLMIVEPEDGGEITISKIRDVQNFLNYKAYNGGYKIVIVNGAEKMNMEAQSCFLKTLEEPKGETLIFLISAKPEQILPTIYSRCQQIKFFQNKTLKKNEIFGEKQEKILEDFLEAAGSDLAERFKYAKAIDFDKEKLEDILEVVQKLFRHVLMVKIGTEKEDYRDKIFDKYSKEKIKDILLVSEKINKTITTTNASPRLALEVLLMEI